MRIHASNLKDATNDGMSRTRPMKIALMITTGLGGIGRSCWELILALSEIKSKNKYIVFAATKPPFEKLGSNFKFISIEPKLSRKDVLNWIQFSLAKIVKNENINIFHSMHYPLPLTISCKSILTIHDLNIARSMPIGQHPAISKPLYQWLRISARLAERIIVPSQFTKNDVVEKMKISKDKIEVVQWGLSKVICDGGLPDASSVFKKKYRLRQNVILCVSDLIPRKNILRLIQAFGLIKENIPHDLIIIGSKKYPQMYGSLYSQIDILLKDSKLSDRVKIFGNLPDKDLGGMYRCADVFIYPSLFEGFGFPLLEAMACGVPVICSNTSSLPEIAGDAAILVNPYSINALAHAMRMLISNQSEKDRLTQCGYNRIKQFSWEAAARKTFKIYSELRSKK